MTADRPDRHPVPPPEVDPRVTFAAERTLLAWIRTGLALMGFGFVVARFGLFLRELASSRRGDVGAVPASPPGKMTLWVGVALVLTGVVVNALAAAGYVRTVRRLRRGEPITPAALSLGTVLSVLLAALGLAMAVYLVFVR